MIWIFTIRNLSLQRNKLNLKKLNIIVMKNIMKIWLNSLVGLIITLSSCAGEYDEFERKGGSESKVSNNSTVISLADAQNELLALINDIDKSNISISRSIGPRRIRDAYSIEIGAISTRSSEEDSIQIHVFNFENNEGFALMAGDTRIPSLLALAEDIT